MARLILVVDDDPRCVILTTDVLQVHGYETVSATNGRDAVTLAGDRRPDLILMDIQMPIMNGLDATRRIRETPETAAIPIVAMTASVMESQRNEIQRAGIDLVLWKPLDIKALLDRVHELAPLGDDEGNDTPCPEET